MSGGGSRHDLTVAAAFASGAGLDSVPYASQQSIAHAAPRQHGSGHAHHVQYASGHAPMLDVVEDVELPSVNDLEVAALAAAAGLDTPLGQVLQESSSDDQSSNEASSSSGEESSSDEGEQQQAKGSVAGPSGQKAPMSSGLQAEETAERVLVSLRIDDDRVHVTISVPGGAGEEAETGSIGSSIVSSDVSDMSDSESEITDLADIRKVMKLVCTSATQFTHAHCAFSLCLTITIQRMPADHRRNGR